MPLLNILSFCAHYSYIWYFIMFIFYYIELLYKAALYKNIMYFEHVFPKPFQFLLLTFFVSHIISLWLHNTYMQHLEPTNKRKHKLFVFWEWT